jgi:hypothetical protein
VQFGKGVAEGKYDWTAEGKLQLLLPSEFKNACAAKTPCPVISWLPEIVSCCWKIAVQLIIKMDAEKNVRQDFFEWIEAAKEQQGKVGADKGDAQQEEDQGEDGQKEENGDAEVRVQSSGITASCTYAGFLEQRNKCLNILLSWGLSLVFLASFRKALQAMSLLLQRLGCYCVHPLNFRRGCHRKWSLQPYRSG